MSGLASQRIATRHPRRALAIRCLNVNLNVSRPQEFQNPSGRYLSQLQSLRSDIEIVATAPVAMIRGLPGRYSRHKSFLRARPLPAYRCWVDGGREDGGKKTGGSDSPTAKLAAPPLKDPSHRASEGFFSVPRFYSILARFFFLKASSCTAVNRRELRSSDIKKRATQKSTSVNYRISPAFHLHTQPDLT